MFANEEFAGSLHKLYIKWLCGRGFAIRGDMRNEIIENWVVDWVRTKIVMILFALAVLIRIKFCGTGFALQDTDIIGQ